MQQQQQQQPMQGYYYTGPVRPQMYPPNPRPYNGMMMVPPNQQKPTSQPQQMYPPNMIPPNARQNPMYNPSMYMARPVQMMARPPMNQMQQPTQFNPPPYYPNNSNVTHQITRYSVAQQGTMNSIPLGPPRSTPFPRTVSYQQQHPANIQQNMNYMQSRPEVKSIAVTSTPVNNKTANAKKTSASLKPAPVTAKIQTAPNTTNMVTTTTPTINDISPIEDKRISVDVGIHQNEEDEEDEENKTKEHNSPDNDETKIEAGLPSMIFPNQMADPDISGIGKHDSINGLTEIDITNVLVIESANNNPTPKEGFTESVVSKASSSKSNKENANPHNNDVSKLNKERNPSVDSTVTTGTKSSIRSSELENNADETKKDSGSTIASTNDRPKPPGGIVVVGNKSNESNPPKYESTPITFSTPISFSTPTGAVVPTTIAMTSNNQNETRINDNNLATSQSQAIQKTASTPQMRQNIPTNINQIHPAQSMVFVTQGKPQDRASYVIVDNNNRQAFNPHISGIYPNSHYHIAPSASSQNGQQHMASLQQHQIQQHQMQQQQMQYQQQMIMMQNNQMKGFRQSTMPLTGGPLMTAQKDIDFDSAEVQINDLTPRPTFRRFTTKKIGQSGPNNLDSIIKTKRTYASQSNDQKVKYDFAKFLIENADKADNDDIEDAMVEEAFAWLKKLSQAGYPDAMFTLGEAYMDDNKLSLGYSQLLQAAKRSHAGACYYVGDCNEKGRGTKKNNRVAMEFYLKSAHAGWKPAIYRVGLAELYGDLTCKGDPKKAVMWFKRGAAVADKENPEPLLQLALIFENGLSPHIKKDENYARGLLTEGAKLDHAEAQYKLGASYEFGKVGCQTDLREALHWYEQAAKIGHSEAQFALAGFFLQGSPGLINKDSNEAYKWTYKSAIQDHGKAQYAMGYFCEYGIGCVVNLEKAMRWYNLAADLGDERSCKRLGREMPLKTKTSKSIFGFLKK